MWKSFALVLAVCLGVVLGQSFSQRRNFPQVQRQFQNTFQLPTQSHFQVPPPRSPFVQRPFVPILRSSGNGPHNDGSYSFDFLSQDGHRREETGRRVSPNVLEVSGSYGYTSPEGVPVQVSYIADEYGFRAQSPNIPAIPAHSLAQIRAAEALFARQGKRYVGVL